MSEALAIARLSRQLNRIPRGKGFTLGIGDDCAVVPAQKSVVCSIDCSAEGVHFDLRWLTLEQAAARALDAAVSDLAAMGSWPTAALVNLEVPPNAQLADFDAIGRGQRKAGVRLRCPVVGGNIVRGAKWVFTTSVMGASKHVVPRAGAQAGDEIWLVGECGRARVGFELLSRGVELSTLPSGLHRVAAQCLRSWRSPRALVAEGQLLASCAHALIDVSDGLASELGHIARASAARLHVDAAAVLATTTLKFRELTATLGLDPLHVVLNGGEDYALLATGPAKSRPPGAASIGRVIAGTGAYLVGNGRPRRLFSGHDHLASG